MLFLVAGGIALLAPAVGAGASNGTTCTSRSNVLREGTWLSELGSRGNIVLTCQRPRVVVHQGDSSATSYRIVDIRWNAWGGPKARGVGYAVGCHTGTCFRNRADVTALSRVPLSTPGCGPRRYYYATFQIRTKFGTQRNRTSIPQCHFTD